MKIKFALKKYRIARYLTVYKNEKVKWTMEDIVYLSEDVQSSTLFVEKDFQ